MKMDFSLKGEKYPDKGILSNVMAKSKTLYDISLINIDRTIFVLVFFDGGLDMSSEKVRETLSFLFEDVLDFFLLSIGHIEVHRTRKFLAFCHSGLRVKKNRHGKDTEKWKKSKEILDKIQITVQ